MSPFKKAFGLLQQIGKSLMLPVSVLPVAGILLGIGSSKFSWIPLIVSNMMAASGDAIFANLPLIFAIGVARAWPTTMGSRPWLRWWATW